MHVTFDRLALFLTSARPIRRDLWHRASCCAPARRRWSPASNNSPSSATSRTPSTWASPRPMRSRSPPRRSRRGPRAGGAVGRRRQSPPAAGSVRARPRGARLRGGDAMGLPGRPSGSDLALRPQCRPVGLPPPRPVGRRCHLGGVRPRHDPGHAHRRDPRHRSRRWQLDPGVDRPPRGRGGPGGYAPGVLRAMAKSQLQAETDPLTGLFNRRAMEERVRHLREAVDAVRAGDGRPRPLQAPERQLRARHRGPGPAQLRPGAPRGGARRRRGGPPRRRGVRHRAAQRRRAEGGTRAAPHPGAT